MELIENNLVSKLKKLIFIIGLFFIILAFIPIRQVYALSQEWVGLPSNKYGEQVWDKKSIQRNKDGSVRVMSKFIPKNKTEITQEILYTMDINCFEKSFRDVALGTDQFNNSINNNFDWEDPSGDELILGVISQVCDFKD